MNAKFIVLVRVPSHQSEGLSLSGAHSWPMGHPANVSCAGRSCPGLVGPPELSRWKAVFRFNERQLELNGSSRPMVLTWTRHPGTSLLDYAKEEVKKAQQFWNSKEGEQRKKVLKENPQSLSFVAGSEGQTESEETEEEETGEDDEEEGNLPFREKRMQAWMDKLQEELGVKIIEEVAPEEEESASTEPDDASSSSRVAPGAV